MELRSVELSQGQVSYRLLGYGARKILFFHGFPGSSSQVALFNKSVDDLAIEVLCFDRPGYNRTFWSPEDMLTATLQISDELTRLLGWDRFEIVTVSGGTPYGISYAQKYSSRVISVRVICGLGFLQNAAIRKYFSSTQLFSLSYLRFAPGTILKRLLNKPKKIRGRKRNPFFEFFYPTSHTDRDVISKRALEDALNFTLIEAVFQNAAGPKADSRVFTSNWGAKLSEFSRPIHFWHGDEDMVISYHVSELMAAAIPHAGFTLEKGEGHVSLPVKRMTEILEKNLL